MTASPIVGRTNAVDVTVKKGASTASLTLTRYDDGSIEFTDDATGLRWSTRTRSFSQWARKLFELINALV